MKRLKKACEISPLNELERKKRAAQQNFLGFEDDDDDEAALDHIDEYEEPPYDPEQIRVESKNFPVFQIKYWIDEKKVKLKPEFQRNTVWDKKRKSLLIESLMLRIPIPAFYFDEDNDGIKTVIDGLQRLSAINDYMNGDFSLEGLQYLTNECGGKYYDELLPRYSTRIQDAQLTVNVLDARSPENVKFDIFRRVNTGGIPLNAQEIRNILATEQTRDFLKRMATSEEFIRVTRGRVNDVRMDAQEMCLRFIAFYRKYNPQTHECEELLSMAKMMDRCVVELNSLKQKQLEEIFSVFLVSMKRCEALFGDTAFSKPGSELIINKVLFTSWSVTLTSYDCTLAQLSGYRKTAVSRLSEIMEDDSKYFIAISSSTASKISIRKQFQTAKMLMEELLNDSGN